MDDYKQQLLSAKKTVLNWSLGVSLILFILSLLPLRYPTNSTGLFSIFFLMVVYAVVFVSQIFARFKFSVKASFCSFISYLVIAIYTLIVTIINYPSAMNAAKNAPSGSVSALMVGYLIGFIIIIALIILFFKAYRATQKINEILSENDHK